MGNSASLPSLESIGRPFGTERPPLLSLRRHAERQTESSGPVERLERDVRPGGRRRTRNEERNEGRRGERGARPEELRAERRAEDRPTRRSQEAEGRARAGERRQRLGGPGSGPSGPASPETETSFAGHLRSRAAAPEIAPEPRAPRATATATPDPSQSGAPTPLQATGPAVRLAPVKGAGLPATIEASTPTSTAARGPVHAVAGAMPRTEAGSEARPVARAATPAPAHEPTEAQEARRASQVLQQLRMHLHPGLRSATVQLHPAELGRLAIRVSLEEGGVVARVAAESEEALAVLQRHVPELEAAFADQGFGELSFEFVLDQQAGGEPGAQAEGRDVSRELERRLEEDTDHQNPRRADSNGVGVDTYA
jgi:hypothetical protein